MKIGNIKVVDCLIFLLTFAFAFISISVSVGVLNFRKYITDYPLFVLMYFIVLFVFSFGYRKIPNFSSTMVFLYLVIVSMVISILFNRESLSSALFITLTILLVNRCGYISKNGIVFLSAIGLATIPYFKIVSASNSMGINFCLIGIALLNEFYQKKKYNMVLVCGLIFEYFIITTYSRSSILTFAVVYIYYIFMIFGIKSGSFKIVVSTILFICAVFILLLNHDSLQNFFTNKWGGSDVSSGRYAIWEGTIKEGITFFGNGESYFLKNFRKGDSHNIFIEILGRYGAVATFFFVCFTVSLFRKAIYSKDMPSILFLTAYYLLGMLENILILNTRMMVPTIIFYFYVHRVTQCNKNESTDLNSIYQETVK